MIKVTCILIFLLPGYYTSTIAQTGAIFHHLTTDNGLSSNRCNDVVQDSEGFYWIATDEGLNRFDGSACKQFKKKSDDSSTLSNNQCYSLLAGRNGDIWICTYLGLNRYSKKTGKFERFYFYHSSIYPETANTIMGIAEDETGNIWLAAKRLWLLNPITKEKKIFLHQPGDSASVPEGEVFDVKYDKWQKGIWLQMRNSIVFYDLTKQKFFHAGNNPENKLILKKKDVWNIVLDKSGALWFIDGTRDNALSYYKQRTSHSLEAIVPVYISGDKGIRRLSADEQGQIWINYWTAATVIIDPANSKSSSSFLEKYHTESALSNVSHRIYTDRAGFYWICSPSGISIYNPASPYIQKSFLTTTIKTYEGSDPFITSILEEKPGKTWAATNAGLFVMNRETGQQEFVGGMDLNKSYLRALLLNTDGILWVGGEYEIALVEPHSKKIIKKIKVPGIVQSITWAGSGEVLVATWRNGFVRFSKKGELLQHFLPEKENANSLVSTSIICLISDTLNQYAWIGYNSGNGFSKYNFKQKKIEHFRVNAIQEELRAFNTINWIDEYAPGKLWIATFGGGLLDYNTATKEYKLYTRENGLSNDFVNKVVFDKKRNLWISTGNSISVMDSSAKLITATGIDLPHISNDVIHNIFRKNDDKLILFNRAHIVEIDPSRYLDQSYPSKLVFTTFRIFDNEVPLGRYADTFQVIRLSHSENYFSFEYSMLRPDVRLHPEYAYMLEGFDKNWNYVNERRLAGFTNVPPGQYTFRVKATDPLSKRVYESMPVQIIISPPFWKTSWFITLAVITVVGILWMFYRYRINQLKRLLAVRTKISRDLHDEVGVTLSNIQLYSSIAAKSVQKDTDRLTDALQHITHNTTKAMENMGDIVWAINASDTGSLSFSNKLKNYGYEILAPRNIECNYDINELTERKLLSLELRKNLLLIAREAMHNIAKHSEATQATITLSITGKTLQLKITDNGKGIPATNNRNGNGLVNMEKRAAALQGALTMKSSEKNGTTLWCNIPLTNISD